MKKCSKCGIEKDTTEFKKRNTSPDGLRGCCKKCTNIYQATYRNRHPEIIKRIQRKCRDDNPLRAKENQKRYRDSHPNKVKEMTEVYKKKYPEKIKARYACRGMKRNGSHLHHWSYRKGDEANVFSFTKQEHSIIHKAIIYDKELMVYRRSDNLDLLDTVEKCMEFYKIILNKKEPLFHVVHKLKIRTESC